MLPTRARLWERLEQAEERLERAEAGARRLRRECDSTYVAYNKLEEEFERLKTELAEADADRLVKQREIERLEEERSDYLSKWNQVAELVAEVERLRAELDARYGQGLRYLSAVDEVDRLQAENADMRAGLNKYGKEVDHLRAENEQYGRIRDLLVRAVVRATGADEEAVREAPLTCAVRHVAEVERLRAVIRNYEKTFSVWPSALEGSSE